MNQQTKLKLQAFLDRELTAHEAQDIAALLQQDAGARALSAELQETRSLLRHNELELKLPESREFYWSKIERSIRQASQARTQAKTVSTGLPRWLRVFAPALGGVAVLMTVLLLVRYPHSPEPSSYLQEIETPLEDTGAISFHSQSAGMTVVWVQSRTD